MEYYEKLKKYFTEKKISNQKASEILEVSPAMIGRYLSGTANFTPDFTCKLIKEFPDIDLQYIFSEDEEENVRSITELKEDAETYGLKEKDLIPELELIETKIANIRKYLAQSCHTK